MFHIIFNVLFVVFFLSEFFNIFFFFSFKVGVVKGRNVKCSLGYDVDFFVSKYFPFSKKFVLFVVCFSSSFIDCLIGNTTYNIDIKI